jgi:hypothetical protein
MNDKNNYYEQIPEKRCGNCKHIEGHCYPYESSCDIINPENKEVLYYDDPNFVEWNGLCDRWESKEESSPHFALKKIVRRITASMVDKP